MKAALVVGLALQQSSARVKGALLGTVQVPFQTRHLCHLYLQLPAYASSHQVSVMKEYSGLQGADSKLKQGGHTEH